jgi:hypothetical protein
MRNRSLSTLVGLILVASTVASSAPDVLAATYLSLRTVTQIVPDGLNPATVADASGFLHVVYRRTTDPGVWYSTNASGKWVATKISSMTGQPDVAIDAKGRLHVVFANSGSTPGIRYATNRSGSWVTTRLTTSTADVDPAIAVDPLGEVHIVYGGNALGYLTNRRGYWAQQTISAIRAGHPTITLDANRRVHIAFEWDAALGYITDAGGVSWKTTSITAAGARPSIAVHGSAVRVAFSRQPGSTFGIFYATLGSTGWSNVNVYPRAAYGKPSLRLDGAGNAHIAYEDNALEPNIEYATNATGSWVRTFLGRGRSPSVILGPGGTRSFTFASSAIYLRTSSMPAWQGSTVSSQFGDMAPDIATGPDGKPQIAYAVPSGSYAGLRHGVWNGSAFTTTRIRDAGDAPSIAIDGAGKAHIAFLHSSTLWYGTNSTGTWVFDEVSFDGQYSCPQLALGPSGQVHIAALRYKTDLRTVWLTRPAATWLVRADLPTSTIGIGCPDIAVDDANQPVITYAAGKVYLSRLAGGTWSHSSFGDASYRPGRVRLTPAGATVMTFGRSNGTGDPTGGVYVRTNESGSWVTTLVGKSADTDYARHGLAVDGNGATYVAYRGTDSDRGLHEATNKDGSWKVIRIRQEEMYGPEITVNEGGDVDITYVQNGSVGGLNYGVIHVHD